MNATEVSALLAKAKLDDNREITRQVVIRWTEILWPVEATLDDALEAINMHRRESAAYLQPAHIVANLRRIREERSRGHALAGGEDYRSRVEFQPDPKPLNFEAMTAAWNDPQRFHAECAKYQAQLADFRAGIV